MGRWSTHVFNSDAAMDAVEDVVGHIVRAIRRDLKESTQDGVLERPTVAYLSILCAIVTRIDAARVFISRTEVQRWRTSLCDWIQSNMRELASGECDVARLDEEVTHLCEILESRAAAQDSQDEEGPGGAAGPEDDDEDDHGRVSVSSEHALQLLSEEAERQRVDLAKYRDVIDSHDAYRRLWETYRERGEVLWHMGVSPVEPFDQMLCLAKEWIIYARSSNFTMDVYRNDIEQPAIIEVLLGGNDIFQQVHPPAEWFDPLPLEDALFDRRLDWLLVERLRGVERVKLWSAIYEARAREKDSQIVESYGRYDKLILAGRSGDHGEAERLALEQAAWFDMKMTEKRMWSIIVSRGSGTEPKCYGHPYRIDYRLAAILKACHIMIRQPLAHRWLW